MSNKFEEKLKNIKLLIEKFTIVIEVLLAILIIFTVILSVKRFNRTRNRCIYNGSKSKL